MTDDGPAWHCGLHAVNALIAAAHADPPLSAAAMDRITAAIHARERALCPDARDTAPEPRGNYPMDAVLCALGRYRLQARYVPHAHLRRPPTPRLVGYLLTFGGAAGAVGHYVALVRRRRAAGEWELWDDGNRRDAAASPNALVERYASLARPTAVLAVRRPAEG